MEVPDHLRLVLKLTKNAAERIENEMALITEGHALPDGLFKQLNELTGKSASLGREIRSWVGKVNKHMDDMSLEDRMKMTITFIESLSTGDRKRLYEFLRDSEVGRSDTRIPLHVGNV
jgi:hypothetical protein